MIDRAAHPRPQFVRERWTDLDGPWGFAHDDDERGLSERWQETDAPFTRTIVVPYPPESDLSGIGEPGHHPVVWYRRELDLPPRGADERLLLHFGAVDYRATVWLNGRLLGEHEGGHTPFTFDLTDRLARSGEPPVLVIRAEDRPLDFTQPRGKQDWRVESHGIWYGRTTGIWQPVWLEPVPATYLREVRWSPDLTAAGVGLVVRLNRSSPSDLRLRAVLRLDGEVIADHEAGIDGEMATCHISIPGLGRGPESDRLRWSPETPTLVEAELTLRDSDGTTDTVQSYVGLRSVGVRDGRFLLNGESYYLRMVLEQGYWPESHLAAPSADALRREVELIRQLGFNGVRVHQKLEDPRFLYWCDRLGLIVWGEMPNAYEFSPEAVHRLVGEWMEALRRDHSHPSIVAWVPLNESWGVPAIADAPEQQHFASALYHLTNALDPTRPVISNDGWEHTESDIWSVHDYAPTGDALRERYGDREAIARTLHGPGPGRRRVLLRPPAGRGQPVVLSEFGGLSITPAAGQEWAGYATVGSTDQLLERFADLVSAVLDSEELAGFCYTQLTDTLQERNGLLQDDRSPKLPIDAVREVLTGPSRALPSEEVDAARRAARRAAEAT
jgi:beta-galactosidase/beta-glucuronidase